MEPMNFNFLCDEPPPPSGASVGIVGADKSQDKAGGHGSHGGHIAQIDGQGLGPDLAGGEIAPSEMDVFHKEVGGDA